MCQANENGVTDMCGRIAMTLHILRLADEPGYRRQIKSQANLQEGRHSLARKIFHGRSGQLYQRYQDSMEDQIGALGLVLNALVLFNTRYMDAAVNQLRADGFDVRDEDVALKGCLYCRTVVDLRLCGCLCVGTAGPIDRREPCSPLSRGACHPLCAAIGWSPRARC